MESELSNVLPAILKYSADKGYVQKKDVERAVSAIQPILDRETKKAIAEELKAVASHNNSEYTSDYIEMRITELTKKGKDE